jgi:hypothetical protein
MDGRTDRRAGERYHGWLAGSAGSAGAEGHGRTGVASQPVRARGGEGRWRLRRVALPVECSNHRSASRLDRAMIFTPLPLLAFVLALFPSFGGRPAAHDNPTVLPPLLYLREAAHTRAHPRTRRSRRAYS